MVMRHRACTEYWGRQLSRTMTKESDSIRPKSALAPPERRGRGAEPDAGVGGDQRHQSLAHLGVISVEPVDLLRRHEVAVDEAAVDRRERQGFKTVERLF